MRYTCATRPSPSPLRASCLAAVTALLAGAIAGQARAEHTTPRPECRSEYGQTVCGYHCVAAYGQVKCAATPAGVCHAAYGQITCFDPPAATHPYYGGPWSPASTWPPAECKSEYGVTVCGYHCVAAYGQVKCATTPYGQCRAAQGEIVCFDPERTP